MKNTIDEAIYVSSSEIIRHRYNPILGIILTAGSIALLWANTNIALFEQHEILSQWNLLIASCILCTGLTMICYRLFGDSSAPIVKRTKERLYRMEFSFDGVDTNRVKTAFEKGNFSMLNTLPRSVRPTTQVICYRTDSGSVMAAQVLQNQEPTSEIHIFHEGEYAL